MRSASKEAPRLRAQSARRATGVGGPQARPFAGRGALYWWCGGAVRRCRGRGPRLSAPILVSSTPCSGPSSPATASAPRCGVCSPCRRRRDSDTSRWSASQVRVGVGPLRGRDRRLDDRPRDHHRADAPSNHGAIVRGSVVTDNDVLSQQHARRMWAVSLGADAHRAVGLDDQPHHRAKSADRWPAGNDHRDRRGLGRNRHVLGGADR